MRIIRRTWSQQLTVAIVSILAATAARAQAEAPTIVSAQPGESQTALQSAWGPYAQRPLTYGVDAGVAETDNVNLSPSDKVSQTIAVANADFDVNQRSRLFDADAKGSFTDLNYLQGAYGNQLVGRFDGSLRAALIPDRLTWVVQDDFGQTSVDPFTPTTPNNLQNENYFSTGPDLTLPFGGTEFVNMGARYTRTSFQDSPFNSNRLSGNLAWGIRLSAASTLSVHADVERVLFTDTVVNTDYTHTDAFARYQIDGARTIASLDLGVTRLSQAEGLPSPTGPLAKLSVARRISAASTVTLTAGSVFTDASSAFSGLQSGAIGVVGAALAPNTTNSYTDNYAGLAWAYVRGQTTLGLSGRWDKETYEGQSTLDVTHLDGELSLGRQFTRSFSAQLLGRLSKTNYPNAVIPVQVLASNDYDDDLIGAVLTWHYGRGLEIKLRAEHAVRTADGPDTGYKVNRAILTVGYRPNTVSGPNNPNL